MNEIDGQLVGALVANVLAVPLYVLNARTNRRDRADRARHAQEMRTIRERHSAAS